MTLLTKENKTLLTKESKMIASRDTNKIRQGLKLSRNSQYGKITSK